MALTFKEYVLIANAIQEIQLEEGALDDARELISKATGKSKALILKVIKMLGPNATKEQIRAKIKEIEADEKSDKESISKTASSKAFHARRAEQAAKAAKGKSRTTVPTISHHSGIEDAKRRLASLPSAGMRAGQLRHAERSWMGEETLEEALSFLVTYRLRSGGDAKTWTVTARDANQAKRKFSDSHYGAKLISVEPEPMNQKVITAKKTAS